MSLHSRAFPVALLLVFVLIVACAARAADPKIDVSTQFYWYAQSGISPNDPLVQLMKTNPEIRIRNWSGLPLPGGAGRTPLMMAIAGQTAPDLYFCWYHIIRNDIRQGFVHPLNEWIGDDTNSDGQVSDDEAHWSGWKDIPPLWKQVATVDGKIYGLPVSSPMIMGVIYRIDMVRQAGLDPNHPPQTWDEFFYWCQKLTVPRTASSGATNSAGQRGFAISYESWRWLPWVQSAGGSPVEQVRRSPTTGKDYVFPMEATTFFAPDTGEDLMHVPSNWRANFTSDAAIKATDFYHRLRWQRWIRDRETGEPVNLTAEQVKTGKVRLDSGRVITFAENEINVGVVRPKMGQPGDDEAGWISRGEVAMIQLNFENLTGFAGLNPNLLGAFAIPAGPGGKRVVQYQRHFIVMSEGVARREKRERDAVWKVMLARTSPESADEEVRRKVLAGNARFMDPATLLRLGYADYIWEIPPSLRELYAGIDTGEIAVHTEPFTGYWVAVAQALDSNVTSLLLSESGEKFNYVKVLREVEHSANTGLMFERDPRELDKYRPLAWAIFVLVAAIILFFLVMIIRGQLTSAGASRAKSKAGVYHAWIPWVMLLPALLTIGVWGYYPLARGIEMAFLDYHIVGKSPWVGIDNFINIFLNPDFYIYMRQTFKFVFLNIVIAFPAPILLALLLSEIPWGKILMRSIFFLPQVTSGLVIILLWKLMYAPNEQGLLNQIMRLFGQLPKDWLGDPQIAMMATILPGLWAGMGMASLIYLAALKGIPDELYEAAGIDGAGVVAKIRYITIPQLMPLIIINFVGAFIGTFQSMGNIFLLTFGGPGKETMVMSMAIWIEAYNNLRFSTATAMAWILGSMLIGFAYMQIRMLGKVEFRRVEEV